MNDLIPFPDIEKMAIAIAKSKLFGMQTPEQVIALMLIAQAEGKHPAIVARDYDIIQGRPSKKSEAMLRDFLAAGGSMDWNRLDDECADATFQIGEGKPVRIVWDMQRANRAGLAAKDMWKKYPRQMLRSRVVSEGIRTVCPAATSGMYVPEEVRDFDQPAEKAIKEASPEPKELPEYPADQFEKNSITWRTMIESGKKTPDDIIKMIGTRYRLSVDQIEAIQSMIQDADYEDID